MTKKSEEKAIMVKLIQVESLGVKRYVVLFSQNGIEQKQVILYCQDLWLESLGETMPYIVPEDTSFFDVWGQDLEFRREIFSHIQTIRESTDKFPQAV